MAFAVGLIAGSVAKGVRDSYIIVAITPLLNIYFVFLTQIVFEQIICPEQTHH